MSIVLIEQEVRCCTIRQVYGHKMRQQELPVCELCELGQILFHS